MMKTALANTNFYFYLIAWRVKGYAIKKQKSLG